MREQFLLFIKKNKLFEPKERILLAVSGGIDSVVMTELFHQAQFKFGIAHCNFQLREKESDEDEKFVKGLAKKYGVDFFTKRFSADMEAKQKKISVQMAARDLRYAWFEEIINAENYYKVAIAHHLGDSVETFFINLLRGTGIDGIIGIRPKTHILVRPLLFAERDEIEIYAKENNLLYREDSSNLTDDYLRNKIRHKLIPVLKKLNPKFEHTMWDNMSRFDFINELSKKAEAEIHNLFIRDRHHCCYILIPELKKYDYPEQLLYELIHLYGFNFSQCAEMLSENAATQSGKIFYADYGRILRDRGKIILDSKLPVDEADSSISEAMKTARMHFIRFKFAFSNKRKNTVLPSSNSEQWLDADLLKFPLTIRKWKEGDYFFPLGMKNRKKLSDFFIDEKMNIFEKEKIYLLASEDQIVCILGHRIDDRFKIKNKTKRIYKIVMADSYQ